MSVDLQAVARAFKQSQSVQMQLYKAQMQFMRPSCFCGTPNIFQKLMMRSLEAKIDKLEGQLGRLENILNKMTAALEKLSGQIGGGNQYIGIPGGPDWHNGPFGPDKNCWLPPHRCGTGGNNWETGWGGGGNADPGQVIAGKGRIWGDPHFIGADGGKYDVQGEAGKIYNLLSDDGFQMNGRFDDWGGKGATVVGKVGINAKGDNIIVNKDGSVSVNGRELADGERVRLTHGGYVKKDGDNITVKSGEWKVDFQAKDSSRGDYLNMDVSTKNAVADGVKPHGLLGQTFDGDGKARHGDKGKGAQGGGAIENLANVQTERGDKESVVSYEVSSLTDTNFTSFNRFKDLSGMAFDAQFDDWFDGGFDNGWGFASSDDALQAVTQAYGALSLSMVSSMSMSWTGFQWNNQYG